MAYCLYEIYNRPRPFSSAQTLIGRGSWGVVMTSSKNLKWSNQHEIWSRDIIWREEFKNRGPERGGAVFWGGAVTSSKNLKWSNRHEILYTYIKLTKEFKNRGPRT